MSMAGAFKKAQKQKEKLGQKLTIEIPERNEISPNIETNPEQVPMMYRAQVRGRCSLQFARNDNDLTRWLEEWIYPKKSNQQPSYQHLRPSEGLSDGIYRLILQFPFRIVSNCGQDSFSRPVIGKYGIPFIPGSGVKGLFERLSRNSDLKPESRNKIKDYCGTKDEPGWLRFHGAYPVGDWSASHEVNVRSGKQVRYRISDVVHPQERKQVKGDFRSTAIAQISFYQPTLVFELSSRKNFSENEWNQIGTLLKTALRAGIGGKTSTGYGFAFIPRNTYPLWIDLEGVGVSATLRNDEPEFRPNLFKATLRSHMIRLLGGVCPDFKITQGKINQWFGHTGGPGIAEIYWDQQQFDIATQGNENTPIFKVYGRLNINIPQGDLIIFQKLLIFSYLMAGWGKTWRRAWHKGPETWHSGFYKSYIKRAIGCHWCYDAASFNFPNIKSPNDLKQFLTDLQNTLKSWLKINQISSQNFKEAWNPNRLVVFSKVTQESQAIKLFHQENFKTTPAIGGRKPGDQRPTSVSSVWHRMLPIGNNQFLEIVTVFHGDRQPWQRNGVNQLQPFTKAIKDSGLTLTWGTDPSL